MPVKLSLIAVLAFPVVLSAQGYHGDTAIQPSRANGIGQAAPILTVPYAQVRVYTAQGALATVYSDAALSVRLSQPVIADATGRYGFYAASGNYTAVVASSTGAPIATQPFTVGGGGSGAVLPPSIPLLATNSAGTAVAAPPVANSQLATPNTTINGQVVPLGSAVTITAALPGSVNTAATTAQGGIQEATASAGNYEVKGVAKQKLPRIDVSATQFGSGCPNAADPTGVLDSTCAIRAAVAFALSQPTSTNSTPSVYFPGTFLISDVLRVPCNVTLLGDSKVSSVIHQTSLTANGITWMNANNTPTTNGYVCQGGLRNISITGAGHLQAGSLIETLQTTGINLENVAFTNSGGRCINFTGQTERVKATNVEIDDCRWPWILAGNENHVRGLQINNPGGTADGWSFDIANAVNGVVINENWNAAQVPASLSCTSGTCTVVVTGGAYGSNTNGSSPLQVGHAFQLAGVTGVTAANGIFRVATVASSTPTASQYTITFALAGASGTGNVSSATFKPVRFPTHNAAVTMIGANVVLEQGSIKALQHSLGVDAEQTYGSRITDIYFEGYPVNGSPRVNSDIISGNLPQQTTLTATLSPTATTVPVASTTWMYNFINDNTDAATGLSQGLVMLAPPDYQRGSTAASSVGGGITRGMFENAYVTFSGGNVAYMFQRNVNGSTAPSGTTWAAGTQVILYAPGANYSMLKIANNHLQGVDPPNSNWAAGCDDTVPSMICGSIIAGGIENGATTTSTGSGGPSAFAFLDLDNNEYWGDGTDEYIGDAFVKYVGGGGQLQAKGSANATNVGVDSNAINGVLVGNGGGAPYFRNIKSQDGSYPNLTYLNMNNGIRLDSNQHQYRSTVLNYNDSILGTNPFEPGLARGTQLSGSDCIYDVPGFNQTHSQFSDCIIGGPNLNGIYGGRQIRRWNGTAWVVSFAVDGTGTISNALSTAIASAGTISPANTGTVHVTGTAAITNISPPNSCTYANTTCQITLIPDGAFTTATGGNIALASTAVVGRPLTMTYDSAASKWYPSY